MRLIHCADLHLDSKMTANFDKSKATERRAEILASFVKMVKYASNNDIRGILIAGDMFDTAEVSALTRNMVLETIKFNPDITFFYLKGNHDKDGFIDSIEEVPENLKLFNEAWTAYEMGYDSNVTITATELSAANSAYIYDSLQLDPDSINIVMLHGQEMTASAGDNTECVNLRRLQDKSIDYLALGHIHSYKLARLDARGLYAYPGCLEGRGFDEPGRHGFITLDIDESTKTVKAEFEPFASRELFVLDIDISECLNSAEIVNLIEEKLEAEAIDSRNLIEIILSGEVDVECEKNPDFIRKRFEHDYYFVKVTDKSKLRFDFEAYKHDESLKGEFVRKVMEATEMTQEEKMEVIKLGLSALSGEELDICD